VTFSHAICSSPTCFPSRSAIFTGIHPARSGNIVNDNGIHPWRFYADDAVTLPKHPFHSRLEEHRHREKLSQRRSR
jgi:arylsulfatase A-like enzyme